MRRLLADEWAAQANIVHDFKYDYSESIYLGGKKRIRIICPTHGAFEQNAANHIYLGRGCPKCSTGMLLTKEEWIVKAQNTHGAFFDYSKVEFSGVKKQVLIICPIHGEFLQIAEKHFDYGCQVCGGNKPLTVQKFIERAIIVHGNKYDYSLVKELNGTHNKLDIVCPKHGLWRQTPANHLRGQGCKYCSVGNSSKKEQLWLDDCGVPNDQKHRNVFIHIGGKKLCVDGVYQEQKVVYEFLGDFWHGHPIRFDPNKLNGVNKKRFSELFAATVDRIRLLRKHGYKVISIWESSFDKG